MTKIDDRRFVKSRMTAASGLNWRSKSKQLLLIFRNVNPELAI